MGTLRDSVAAFTLLITLSFLITGTFGSACSKDADGKISNLTECITGIQDAAVDESWFWFGTDYARRCPPYLQYTFYCFSFNNVNIPKSLSSQLFTPGSFDKSKINTYVDVQYTSEPGTYEGCGNTYTISGPQVFRADPLSSRAHEPWTLRNTPDITWTARNDTSYTLLVVDVGFFFMHGLFINIPGDDFSKAQVVKPYHGPRNMRDFPNPYAFMLFEQKTENMTVLPQWKAALYGTSNWMARFNISSFAEDQELQGPVGMNWVLASLDPYAVKLQSSVGIENCAFFVQQALRNHSRPFLPPRYSFNVFVDVTFTSPAISFTHCCQQIHHKMKNFKLNPLGSEKVSTADTRSATTRSVTLRKSGIFPNASVAFAGQYLTLLMVDPDVPYAAVGTKELPLVHWMVMNIENGDIEEGEEVLSYRGPMPPDQLPHTYYYLLYQQRQRLPTNDTARFAGSCSARHAGRCLYNVTEFARENELTLVGATWMTAENDAYVNFTKIQDGQPASQFCAWTPGYADPCPTSRGVKINGIISSIAIVILLTTTWM